MFITVEVWTGIEEGGDLGPEKLGPRNKLVKKVKFKLFMKIEIRTGIHLIDCRGPQNTYLNE